MLPEGNTPPRRAWSVLAVLIALALALALAAVAPASARADGGDEPGEGRLDPAELAEPLSEPLARQAFVLARNWVVRAEVPDRALPIHCTDLSAIHVTIRFEGVTLGQATASRIRPLDALLDERSVNLTSLLRDAVRHALLDARRGLLTMAGRPGNDSVPTKLETVAPLLSVDVQFAAAPQRLIIQQVAQLPERFVIGLHGLALRSGDRWSWQFPGAALAANLSLQAQLNQLLEGLGMPVTALPRIGGDPAIYRFRAIHLAATGAAPPVRLVRGQQPLPPAGLDLDAIRRLSDRWASHLLGRQEPDGRFAGTYHPTSDRYDPKRALPVDAALAAYALARHARAPGGNEDLALAYGAAARIGVQRLLRDFGLFDPKRKERTDSATAILRTDVMAMTLLALREAPAHAAFNTQRDHLAESLIAAYGPETGFRLRPLGVAGPAPKPTQALAAFAMVRLYEQTRNRKHLDIARATLARCWEGAENEPAPAFGAMPWAAMAEFELARLRHASPGLLAAKKVADALWKTQVRPPGSADAASPDHGGYVSPDLVGGLDFEPSVLDEPTWRSAGPLAALAAALAMPNFVGDDDRPRWLLETTLGLRFCAQLTMDETAAYYVHRRPRALGGVRAAMYDNRQPLHATALALLAAAEFQHALDRLAD